MPKGSNRCKGRTQQGVLPDVSASLMAAPRKVSFEDNFPDSSERGPASPAASRSLGHHSTEQLQPLRKKSSLTRPKSSLSLVELAQSVEDSESNSSTVMTIPAPVSPLSSNVPEELSPSFPLLGSPWGHFVDMAAPEEETSTSSSMVPQHSYGAPCSCCFSCRRRRANPYGDYRRRRQHSLSSISSSENDCSLSFFRDSSSWSKSRAGGGPFRLTPRKSGEPTEQLIGALDRLQVD